MTTRSEEILEQIEGAIGTVVEAVIRTIAFFISPDGKVIEAGENHIAFVINHLDLFGLTKQGIEAVYQRHGEQLYTEGKAREEILKDLVNHGWIRLRRYPNKFWSINVDRLTGKKKDFLYDWAKQMLTGEGGFKEPDPYMLVKIDTREGQIIKYTVSDIADDVLIQESKDEEVGGRARYRVTFVRNV